MAAATAALVQQASLIPQNQQDVLIEAGAGNDVVIGTETGFNRIHGGDGVDALYAGGFVSDLHGEAGSDYLAGGGFEAHLYGGAGTDVFGLAHNTFVMDATADDVVTWGSFRLTGGVQQWPRNTTRKPAFYSATPSVRLGKLRQAADAAAFQ